MKNLVLAVAAAGAIALAVPTTPSAAAPVYGLKIAPQVDAGPVEVRRRCYHRRYSSRWRCHHVHRRWESRQYRRYHHAPGFYRSW